MRGLKQGTIELLKHDEWMDQAASDMITSIKAILGDDYLNIDHIGSTSIPSIKAKPIIDLALHVKSFKSVINQLDAFKALGFIYKANAVLPDALYFNLTKDQISYFHLHVFENYSQAWKNHIYFRDYLRKYLSVAKRYEALKEKLMTTHQNDRVTYTLKKATFILDTIKDAQCDYFLGKKLTIKIDRPIGSMHPKHPEIIYPINYGYIEGEFAQDNEELDVYLLEVGNKVDHFYGEIIGYVRRLNDIENKLIMVPVGQKVDQDMVKKAIHFQEQFYQSELILI
ncbi:MAG: GrpB family protein [Candidatus Izemoplasmataceae bacterium]